jgi:hypothetical protein
LCGLVRLAAASLSMSAAMAAHAAPADSPAKPYLGRWDVTLQTPERAYSSWLDIQEVNGEPKVRMVGRWGHARWLPRAEIVDGKLRFVSPKEEEGREDGDMVFEGERSGADLVGQTKGPDGAVWSWRGARAPALARKAVHWGTPVKLFDGKDLTGWSPLNPAAMSWRADGATLISAGSGTDLRTKALFGDFKLHLEFNCAKGANSGVYLRGRYEVQIENDAEPEAANMRTGGVYGYLAAVKEVARTSGVWQTYDITLVGRWVTVVLNGKTLIKNQEIPGITGGALDSNEGLPGPLVLQGSEAGQVAFRNIVITPAR